ncbi:AmmeMemoRadiSam system protein B [Desulfosoma caldarium]|uniref:AmmeMemoRadiSam system protein B n=1 Tax=Desulfosoma caldarium TaxID=610254 RepID=A0A3N1UYB7_9BACT|nr:AmmeMemoRadiSam system protein B [Desulfosoma caldarium]ROQ92276.1 hypothetical protein EDC27_1979 [Desulfosoma caldarium]
MEYPKLRLGLEAVPVHHGGQSLILLRDRLGYNDKPVLLQPEFASVLALMDGRHSVRDIQAFIVRRTGQLVHSDQIRELIRILDENLLLDNARFAEHVQREWKRFREDPIRRVRHAAKSYPAEPQELRSFLDSMLRAAHPLVQDIDKEAIDASHRKGPFSAAHPDDVHCPAPVSPHAALVGLVAPHIDMRAGATTFGCAYGVVGHIKPPDVWVILGTGHEPIENAFAMTLKDFETPLGLVACDRRLALEIVRRSPQDILAGEYAHNREHTIEFQAVFLAHVQPKARIVPILCSFDVADWVFKKPVIDRFCDALREAAEEAETTVGFLASVDLAHIGPRYGDDFVPHRFTIQEHMEEDRKLLEALREPNPDAFMDQILRDGNGRKVCGVPPLYVLSRVLQGSAQGRVLHHDHAVVDPQGSFVTFAAMAFIASSPKAP